MKDWPPMANPSYPVPLPSAVYGCLHSWFYYPNRWH
ncbi:MAG: CRISPR-associated protein Cas5 [Sediminibacterium magnilacihabitans]|nr:CRISPR-associated protein Cas5 [Sediminibacterium magnilacihabitans]